MGMVKPKIFFKSLFFCVCREDIKMASAELETTPSQSSIFALTAAVQGLTDALNRFPVLAALSATASKSTRLAPSSSSSSSASNRPAKRRPELKTRAKNVISALLAQPEIVRLNVNDGELQLTITAQTLILAAEHAIERTSAKHSLTSSMLRSLGLTPSDPHASEFVMSFKDALVLMKERFPRMTQREAEKIRAKLPMVTIADVKKNIAAIHEYLAIKSEESFEAPEYSYIMRYRNTNLILTTNMAWGKSILLPAWLDDGLTNNTHRHVADQLLIDVRAPPERPVPSRRQRHSAAKNVSPYKLIPEGEEDESDAIHSLFTNGWL